MWSQLTTPFLKMKVSRMFDSPFSCSIKSSFATSCLTYASSSADTQQLSEVWLEQTFSMSHSMVCRCRKVFLTCTSFACEVSVSVSLSYSRYSGTSRTMKSAIDLSKSTYTAPIVIATRSNFFITGVKGLQMNDLLNMKGFCENEEWLRNSERRDRFGGASQLFINLT